MGFERDLVINMTVNKKSNDLGKLTTEATKSSKALADVKKTSKEAADSIEKMEQSGTKLGKSLKEIAGSLFIFGSASSGIERLIINFVKLQSVLNGLKASKDVLDSIRNISGGMGGSAGDRLLNISRLTGINPKTLSGWGATAGKYALPGAVGAGAGIAAGVIKMGVNNASGAFEAAGGAANLGHTSRYGHDAQGNAYAWQRGYNQMRATGTGSQTVDALYNMFAPGAPIGVGGGKLDSRGNFVDNDEWLARAGRRRKAEFEIQHRNVGIQEKARGYETQRLDLGSQQAGIEATTRYTGLGRHYRDVVSGRMTGGSADYSNVLNGQDERFKLLYGEHAGPEKLRAMQNSLREQSRGVGTNIGEAEAAEKRSRDEVLTQRKRLDQANAMPVGILGGKENQGEALARDRQVEQESRKLIELEEKHRDVVKQRQAARLVELTTMRDQAHSIEQMAKADAAAARTAYHGMKQDIGGQSPSEARITIGLIKRAKEKGLESLTPEARSRVAAFLPKESEKFRDEMASKLGFDEAMRGTSAERRIGEAEALAGQAEKQKINLEQNIDFTAIQNSKEVADLIMGQMPKLFESIKTTVTSIETRVKALEEGAADAATAFTGATGKPGK